MILPILERELRSRARSRSTYWTRVMVGLAGILVCFQTLEWAQSVAPAAIGRWTFRAILAAAFLASCAGCLLTADAISGERREGTLALLFLTRVTVMDVILGKLGSAGIAGLFAMVAFVPVLALPMLAGGVGVLELLRTALALLNSLFFALVAGLYVSAAATRGRQPVRRAIALVGAVVLVPFVFTAWLPLAPLGWFGVTSPLVTVELAGATAYAATPELFWVSLVSVSALSWGLLVATVVRLRRQPAFEEVRKPSERARREAQRSLGLGRWQPDKNDASPIEWMVYRRSGVSVGIWGLAVMALAAHGWAELALSTAGPGRLFSAAYAFMGPAGIVADLVGGAMVAYVASRFFVAARPAGDLELLLTTPLGAEMLVSEQWYVLRRLFVWPVLMLQAVLVPFVLSGMIPLAYRPLSLVLWVFIPKALCVANAYLGAAALCWTGLWFGLKARTQAQAVVWTTGLAKGAPLLLGLLASFALNAWGWTDGALAAFLWAPQALVLSFYMALIGLVRRELGRDAAGVEPVAFARMGDYLPVGALSQAFRRGNQPGRAP